MSDDGKCLGRIVFKIEEGKVVSYINGEKNQDYIPIRAKQIHHMLRSRNILPAKGLTYRLIKEILRCDEIITRDLMNQDNIVMEEETPLSLQEDQEILKAMYKKYKRLNVQIDENFIREFLYYLDIVIIQGVTDDDS